MTGTQGSEPRVLRYCIEYMQCTPASTKMMCAGVLRCVEGHVPRAWTLRVCQPVPKYLSLCSPALPRTATVHYLSPSPTLSW